MSYHPGDRVFQKKGQTIRQFCRENKMDYPVIYRICEKLEITKNNDELYIIDQFDASKIFDYITRKNVDVLVFKIPQSIFTCSCGYHNTYNKERINKMMKWYLVCENCLKIWNITKNMILVDKI